MVTRDDGERPHPAASMTRSGEHAVDRLWRGYDAEIRQRLPAAARVLDVGCGDGGLVEQLRSAGLDAVGVDPHAPAGPHLISGRVEQVRGVGRFDAVCAVMSLHHASLDDAVPALAGLLRDDGHLFVYELEKEAFDERAAAWLRTHHAGSDVSVESWLAQRADLHTGGLMRERLRACFVLRAEPRPYLARQLGDARLEDEEQRLIVADELPPLGRWYVGRLRPAGSA